MAKMEQHLQAEVFDVIVIGAGISGINAAYRIQDQLSTGTTYTILESRGAIGGTWDLFRYPGIRSDSDLYTFGFPWKPWRSGHAIAEGPAIVEYLTEAITETGIDRNIRLNQKVIAANWSSEDLIWTLEVQTSGQTLFYKASFVIFGTGYYDYDKPLEAIIPGLENFGGQTIHPQFWPENLDTKNKEIVIIGSGATAVTLLPNIAKTAKMVTMVQRSPSYVFSLPTQDDWLTRLLQFVFSAQVAHSIIRWRFLFMNYSFFYFCRAFPSIGKSLIRSAAKFQLPKDYPVDTHFKPAYNPWSQRLCISPNGDFYSTLNKGNACVVTGVIDTVTKNGLRLADGTEVNADIIVTATGLKVTIAGGIKISVDKELVDVSSKYLWKGAMLQDVPNACVVIGYTNASWTLGADATAQMMMRLINLMEKKQTRAVIPRLTDPGSQPAAPMLNIDSTYIKKAMALMPKTGEGQWAPRRHYFGDIRQAKWGDIETGIEFVE